jgi:hypothetical protein
VSVVPVTVDVQNQEITITTPPHAGVRVDVQVQTPGGLSATDPFATLTYVDPPQVSGLTPSSGPAAGNTPLRISGMLLDTVHTVSIGGNDVKFTFDSVAQELLTTTPGGGGAVDVVVTGIGGPSAAGPTSSFTYT